MRFPMAGDLDGGETTERIQNLANGLENTQHAHGEQRRLIFTILPICTANEPLFALLLHPSVPTIRPTQISRL